MATSPTPVPHSFRLAAILQGLLTIGALAVEAFVKNPAHHDKAEAVLGIVTQVATPIVQTLGAQDQGVPPAA